MRFFLVKIFIFCFLPLTFIFILMQFYQSSEEKNIELYNSLQGERNIIIIGDSRSLVDLNYPILKKEFQNYSIINLSLWARNPRYIYSVYKDVFKNKKITNSIIVYNLTFRHVINMHDNVYNTKEELKGFLKQAFNKDFKFEYFTDSNNFIYMRGQNFGSEVHGIKWYKNLELEYDPDFQTQLAYVDSIKNLFETETNHFIVTDMPHDKTLDSIYQNSKYYAIFQENMHVRYPNNLYFGYLKELENSSYWYNRDHLNLEGTRVFTPIFISRLKNYIKHKRTSKTIPNKGCNDNLKANASNEN